MASDAEDKSPRRANGEGSVFFWPGRGWYAAITGSDGRRVQRKAPKQTERGAESLLRQLLAQRDSGELTRGATTFSEFKEEWLRACRLRNCRPRTLDAYREKVEKHLEPALGKKRLSKITAGDVERLYHSMVDAGLAASSIKLTHVCLHNLLKLAKRRKLVGQVVTEMVDPPKVEKYEARTLTIPELRQLHDAVVDHRFGGLWTVIAETGARFGEAAGLREQDLDLQTRTARTRKAVKRQKVNGKWALVLEDVKTEAGRREWALTRRAVVALRTQLERNDDARELAGTRWKEQGLVFPNTIGGPLAEGHVNEAWHELLREIGLEGDGKPRVRMHDLRHSKGTVMANEGEDLVVIQRTLGHAKSSITADLYVGKVPKALRGAADRWDALLDGDPPAASDIDGKEAVS
ncbi:MAG: tyrosine-type recombinase/integrase [Chloroflexota bacterium]